MRPIFILSLFMLNASLSRGDGTAAYVPDASCPLTRWGKDVTLDSLAQNMATTSKALRKECPEAAQAGDDLEKFQKEHDAELRETTARAKTDLPGFRKVVLACDNYPRVLKDEFQEVQRRLRARLPAPPNEAYKPSFDPKLSPQIAQQTAEAKFRELNRTWNLDCERMKRENSLQVRKTVDEVTMQEMMNLARLYVDQASACLNQKRGLAAAQSVVSSVVQVAALASSLEPGAAAMVYGVKAGNELLKLAIDRLRDHLRPPGENDPTADRKRRELGCLVIAASQERFCAKPEAPPAPSTGVLPPNSFLVTMLPKLEELDQALSILQTQPIEDVIHSNASPHPLDRLSAALNAPITARTPEGKSKEVTLATYLLQVAQSQSTVPAGAKDRAARSVTLLDAQRLKALATAVAQWKDAPLEEEIENQRAIILRARGVDPTRTDRSVETPADALDKNRNLVRSTELALRLFSTMGYKEPVEAFRKWRAENPKAPAATARLSIPSAAPTKTVRIDEAAGPMNLSYTELIHNLKPTMSEWIAAATKNTRGNSSVTMPSPQGPIPLRIGSHVASAVSSRRAPAGAPTNEPTAEEVSTLSEIFDASVFPLVQMCVYMAPAALLGGDLAKGQHSAFHFEEPPRRIGTKGPTSTQDFLIACRPLACQGKGLPLFERQFSADTKYENEFEAREIARFKKNFCRSLDSIETDAIKLKEAYQCFRSPCPPAPGSPQWNFSCAKDWARKYPTL